MTERVIPGLIRDTSSVSAATPFQVVKGEQETEEAKLRKEAGDAGVAETFVDIATTGGNSAVQWLYDIDRMASTGPVDPAWRTGGSSEWLKIKSKEIPGNQQWRYLQTKNAAEAQLMLDDANKNMLTQQKVARRFDINPVGTFALMGLAGLVDVDAPVSFFSGGLSTLAKTGFAATKLGKVLYSGTAGAAAGVTVQTVAYGSNPVEDWTSIPLAGLGGSAFGVAGGVLKRRDPALGPTTEQAANLARTKTLNEFGETTAEGNVRAREDLRAEPHAHADPYGSQRDKEAAQAAAEATTPAEVSPTASLERGADDGIWEAPVAYKGTNFKVEQWDDGEFGISTDGGDGARAALNLKRDGDQLRVMWATVDEPIQNTGMAMKMYELAIDYARRNKLTFTSDTEISPSALRVYAALEKRGYKFKKADTAVSREDGGLDVGTKDVRGGPKRGPVYTLLDDEAPRAPQSVRMEELDEVVPEDAPLEGRATVGARQLASTGPGVSSIRSTRQVDIIQEAQTRNQQIGVARDWNENYSNLRTLSEPLARAAVRFQDFVNATPIATDFARFMRSGSVVGQMLAYDLLENASGIIRNNRSGAMLKDHYHKQMLGNFLPYHDAYDDYVNRVFGANIWRKVTDNSMRERFNREVVQELQERNYGGAPNPNLDRAVSAAADAIDRTFAKEIEINVGRAGEGSADGWDTIVPKSGYFPQKWLGGNMQKLISSGRFGTGQAGRKAVVQAITEAYRSMHPTMDPKDAGIFAEAVVDRALSTSEGISANLVGIMKDNDGRRAIEELLSRNGAAKHEIDRLIDTLTGTKEEAGRAGNTKKRLDLDMRFTASNGIKIMDLLDTDVNKIVAMRANKSAGSAALARKGIYSRAKMDEIRETILREQAANGASQKTGSVTGDFLDADRPLTAQDIDDMFSYFTGAPIAGGISPYISRVRKLTNLALLNQLGITQMAEFGPMIAAVGWKRFGSMAGKEFMDTLKNRNSPLVQELQHMNVFVPEERMFRDDLTFDYEKATGATGEYMQRFDSFLNKAQRLQGYTSGFYVVRKLQQRIAMTTGTSKLMENMKAGNAGFTARMADAGLDPALLRQIQDYIDNGTVEFDGAGKLVKLNLEKWDPLVSENYILSMNRTTNQLVQKAMAGESSAIFHRDGVAALFWHLKSFPMLALEKQAIRNVRLSDQTAVTTFLYGLATAGAAFTIKQTVNGRTENLTPTRVARGAFEISNMTGWIPMWVDPLAGMLGMDDYKLSSYGSYGGTAVLAEPPALKTIDSMVQAPGAIFHMLNPWSDMSNSDVRALQSIPIIGNAVGFTFMFNQSKDYIRNRNRREAAARKREEAPAIEPEVEAPTETVPTVPEDILPSLGT